MTTHKAHALKPTGNGDIDWATRSMPLLAETMALDGKTFAGLHIGICLHIEPKTAVLCRWLLHYGAAVTITGNIGTTDTATAELLSELGIEVIGTRSDGPEAHSRNLDQIIDRQPNLILDNGGDLISRLTAGAAKSSDFRGATEETTTGGRRIRELPVTPNFPVIVINDSQLKLLVENEFGVGQSIVQGFMNATNSMVPGARVTVVGYGPCGKGVAKTLAHLGAIVSVSDTNPFKALEAIMDGHRVGPLSETLTDAQIVFLATGHPGVIGADEISSLSDGVIIAGVGHEANELVWDALDSVTTSQTNMSSKGKDNDGRIVHHLLDGREIITLYGTRMVNLVAAGGNPIQAMDLGLSLQARSLATIARGQADFVGAEPVPANIDLELAASLVDILRR